VSDSVLLDWQNTADCQSCRCALGGYYNNGYDSYQSGYPGAGDGPPVGYGSYGRLAYGGQAAGSGGYRNVGSRGGSGAGSGGRGGGFGGMGVSGGQGGSRGKRPFIGGVISRSGGSGAGGVGSLFESQTGHSVHMRGLPYSATEDDIAQVRTSLLRDLYHVAYLLLVSASYIFI